MSLSLLKICVLVLVIGDQYSKLTAAPVSGEELMDYDTYCKVYGKDYSSEKERNTRAETYARNLEDIKRHNEEAAAGKHTWYKGVNVFTDQTQDEYLSGFKKIKDVYAEFNLTTPDMKPLEERKVSQGRRLVKAAPASFDWRTQPQNIVNPIRDQAPATVDVSGAFAGIATIESAYALRTGNLPQLSEQHSLGCSFGFANPLLTLAYGVARGVPSRTVMPYTGSTAFSCSFTTTYPSTWGFIVNMPVVSDNERIMNMVMEYGLVGVMIEASKLQSYSSGIIPDTMPTSYQYTYANIVGWSTDASGSYWILRYSRGTNWGENGHFRIAMTNTGVSWFVYSPKFLAHYYQATVA